MKKLKKRLVNHVAFVVDASGSMAHLTYKVREVLQNQFNELVNQANKSDQDTYVSVYHFGTRIYPVTIGADVRRVKIDASSYRSLNENTALVDATLAAIHDFERTGTRAGDDNAFLIYVITDGQENASRQEGHCLARTISKLSDDWTMAILVPDKNCKRHAMMYGFPEDNIQIWETTEAGLEEASHTISFATQSYYGMRDAGIKSTKSLFKFDAGPSKTEVKRSLDEVDPGSYETLLVRKADDGRPIRDFVESWTKRPYRVGSAYYQVTKPEIIQGTKTIAVQEKLTGKMYSGSKARVVLGLPNYEVKVAPADFDKFDLFVQSTSTNRKLVKDTQLIVFK